MSIPDRLSHLDPNIQKTLAEEAELAKNRAVKLYNEASETSNTGDKRNLLVASVYYYRLGEETDLFQKKREKRVKKASK